MDKKSKIFLAVLFLFILVSVGVTFWRIYIKKDYIIQNQIDCDPTVDKCFIWKCDPKATVDGEACTGDPDKDTWYYQIAERKAANIPLCDTNDENCKPFECADGEKDCSVTFCNDTNKKEQKVECNDPVQYNIDNPPEESDTTCAEGDEECAAAADGDATCDPATEDCSAEPAADTEDVVAPDQSTGDTQGNASDASAN